MFFLFVSLFSSSKAQEYWHRVAGGLGEVGTGESVKSLFYDSLDNRLWATGTFTSMDDTISCGGIGIWDGNNWTSNTQGGGTPTGTDLILFDGHLWVSGGNGVVGYYNGTTGINVGAFNNEVYCLCVYHNKLYAGGYFNDVNGMQAKRIACYDGSIWSEPGGGIWCTQFPGDVSAMCVWNDKLIVGGKFDQAGGLSVQSLVSWNDTAWSNVGLGVRDNNAPTHIAYVNALCVHEGNLIAGGRLSEAVSTSGSISINNICGFDGSNWFALGVG